MAGTRGLVVDCADLAAFRVFGDYMSLLRNRTSFNETLLRQCEQPICQALWGFGVPDLSGIGIAVGYALSILISTTLCLCLAIRPPQRNHPSILVSGLSSFFESAIYFSLAIQIATMTILAPKDMETAPSSMGYYEIRIAGLVSTISLLPLPIPVLLLSSQSMSKDRHPYRLSVLHFTVVPSVYPFLSQSIRYWAPTTIGEYRGEGGETYVTNEEWGALLDLCFEGGDGYAGAFTPAEHVVLGVFHMLAFVAVLLFSVLLLVPLILRRVDARNGGVRGPMRERIGVLVERAVKSGGRTWVRILLALVPLGLAVPLLWGFWRLRGVQSRLAVAAKGHYEGNDWGFGQVMAIAVFVPVGAEMLFVWAQMRGERRTKAEMSEQARMEKCGLQSSELVRKLEEPRIDGQGRDRINTSPW